MDWPAVTVLICTFERNKELSNTIATLRNKLYYPNLLWLICDDCSPSQYAIKLAASSDFYDLGLRVVNTVRNGGWGVNVNNGIDHVDTDLMFFLEDDKILHRPIDLRVGVAAMLMMPYVGMLRYRGTAGDHFILHHMEVDISEYLPTYQDGVGLAGKLTYCLLDGGSPSLHVYSHGPHLKRKSFHNFYGRYPEGMKLGITEEAMEHQVKDRMLLDGAPPIGILPEFIQNWWDDIGQSYQGTEFDK